MKEQTWYDLQATRRMLKMNIDGKDDISLRERVEWAIKSIDEILEEES